VLFTLGQLFAGKVFSKSEAWLVGRLYFAFAQKQFSLIAIELLSQSRAFARERALAGLIPVSN
jgi:hypothetical protein